MGESILRQRTGDRFDPGYIYVAQMVGHSIYKIGRSSNVPRRMSEIGVQLPFPYRLVFAHKVPYVHYMESDLHRDNASYRKNGEWFELSGNSLDVIQRRLLYAQTEWLTHRVVRRFNEDDLYPNVLRQYGKIFFMLGRRNDRRLSRLVRAEGAQDAEDATRVLVDDVLSAEVVS